MCRMHHEMWEFSGSERRYSVPPSVISEPNPTEDLHAWSIYRQNLNSDFTDSALGSTEKSPLPYGNFQLRESTVNSILSHPKYGLVGRNSELSSNMYTYLKFGLPRVFPPAFRTRDGSSGYDSSEDAGSPELERNSKFRRSRSYPDFRSNPSPKSYHRRTRSRDGGLRGKGIRGGQSELDGHYNDRQSREKRSSYWRDRRGKSNSEANLLNHDYGRTGTPLEYTNEAFQLTHQHLHDHQREQHMRSRRSHHGSKAGSQISALSHNSRLSRSSRTHLGGFGLLRRPDGFYDSQIINEKFFPKDSTYFAESDAVYKYPHLQIRNMCVEISKPSCLRRRGKAQNFGRILDSISLNVRGGELTAIMSTSEYESTLLLDVLTKANLPGDVKYRGDILVNGVHVRRYELVNMATCVRQCCQFAEDMSVRQTLLFTSLLQEPGNGSRSFDTKGRINALIDDLGLGLVKHTTVKQLTMSEKRRLNVACRLVLDSDLLFLDQPTKDMDIFDTFYLVEYLRQWASRGRIVIMTIQPPTYEIFTMFAKVALISTGRMMYFGKRREMLPYFAYLEYPCPAYKNPSDYYLDLVTLDNLSPEAMLESSQRVEMIAETFRQRQESLGESGPPAVLPPPIKRANFLVQVFALWIRALIYMFPYNLISWVHSMIIGAAISVAIGAIYYSVRLKREQEDILDRFAFHYVMTSVAIWPLIFITINEIWQFKNVIEKDLDDMLYSKIAYIISKLMYSFLITVGILLSYVVPAYVMSGLRAEDNSTVFMNYVLWMLLHLYAVRTLTVAFTCTVQSRHLAAVLTGVFFTFVSLASGYTLHLLDLSPVVSWLQWLSPARWTLGRVYPNEFTFHNGTTGFQCSWNPIIPQDNAILVKAECGIQNGAQALEYMHFQEDGVTSIVGYRYVARWPSFYVSLGCVLIFVFFWTVWMCSVFVCGKQRQKLMHRRVVVKDSQR